MLFPRITIIILSGFTPLISALPSALPSTPSTAFLPGSSLQTNISISLFAELEELSRIVDISYCVGLTGISKPFLCASRCNEFPDFELVDTFNTGPLMSDSCGYIVLDHGNGGRSENSEWDGGMLSEEGVLGQRREGGRIIVAFRGTYSIANTIVDLSTVPQEYVPYPGEPDDATSEHQDLSLGKKRLPKHSSWRDWVPRWRNHREDGEILQKENKPKEEAKCTNCTVHTGFWTSWQNTRPLILPHIKTLHAQYPAYKVHLVGHSLGGAVAALAGLEMQSLGHEPIVTTFGEPRVGNSGLRNYIDGVFGLSEEEKEKDLKSGRYRRVTHVDDPVPLLPLHEWGYRSHAGEHYISKPALQPTVSDIRLCAGDEDVECLAGAEIDQSWLGLNQESFASAARFYDEHVKIEAGQMESDIMAGEAEEEGQGGAGIEKRWNFPIPARYKMWQLFFAHRDYFWRLGLCVPGGDPFDWGRDKYRYGNGDEYDNDEKGEGSVDKEEL
ncbi:related to triacylglycerol lipase [Rhynchosporium secalis]|uniref:Related to triacylglycerol lipase n=1 Tax=Rhynchosporium secalis TaxID=38038 RepID=A0A1E1M2P6_RHYSE|nr:related to triacylglycerol lipase [Rhynchosporium secalis]